MKPKLLCLALVLSGGLLWLCNFARADTTVAKPATENYHNDHYGFQFTVPQGWTVTETNFEAAHYYYVVFLTINSRRPDSAGREPWVSTNAMAYYENTNLRQVKPGEAYISIGFCEGPFGGGMQSNSVAEDLIPVLGTNRLATSWNPKLAELNLDFFKRGHFWDIASYAREPVTLEASNGVMSLLKSFQFVDVPVRNIAWAESLAWEQLPENIRGFDHWPVTDNLGWRPFSGRNTVVVEETNSVYSVQFTLTGLGMWNYEVASDGTVQAGPAEAYIVRSSSSSAPSDLPGHTSGKINAYWTDPYVETTDALGKTATTRFDGGPADVTGGVHASYDAFSPTPQLIGLHVSLGGKLIKTLGPYVACYPSYGPAVNDDGSAALLVWTDASKTNSQVIVLNTNGEIRFQTDCGRDIWSPIVAPDGAGVLLRPNGGPNQNTFMWYTEKGKVYSIDVSYNPEFIGWIPQTHEALFSTDIGFESDYQLIDWDTGKRLWSIPGYGERAFGIAVTPTLVIFSAPETYAGGAWRNVNQSLLQSGEEWVRNFYAVNVANGKTVACWHGQFPHRWYDTDRDHFARIGDKLYYVTADEFTEINIGDIMAKKNGWQ